MENYVLESRGYEDLEVMAEKQLERMSQNDKERPNVILQDVDGNTEKNVEDGSNSDTRGIKSISEVQHGMYLPFETMLTYQKTSEGKNPEKWEPTFP